MKRTLLSHREQVVGLNFRAPKRISITLPYLIYQELERVSSREGRSMSNLAAFLLESALKGG